MRIKLALTTAVLFNLGFGMGVAMAEDIDPAYQAAYKACVNKVKKAQPDVNWGTTFFFVEQCMNGSGGEAAAKPTRSSATVRQ